MGSLKKFVSVIIVITCSFLRIVNSYKVRSGKIPSARGHSFIHSSDLFHHNHIHTAHRIYQQLSPSQILKNQIQEINQQNFKVSANDFAPHSFLKEDGQISGNHYEVLKNGALKFNFTYNLEISSGKSTGVQLGNGSWSGMMHDITDGDFDIALVMAETAKRTQFADFTAPIGISHLIFVSTIPPRSVSNVALLTPFHYKVWIFVGIAFMIGTLGIYFMLDLVGETIRGQGFLDVVFWTFGLSMEQTFPVPQNVKPIVVIYVAFVLIIGTGYKCNLASFLATPAPLKKPTNFLQLHNATNYEVYFDISGISGYDYFRNSEQTLVTNLRKRILPSSSSSDCVISAFLELNSVCIGWDVSLPVAIAKNLSIPLKRKKIMYQSSEHIFITYASIAFRKNFQFQHLFNFIGTSCFEAGLSQKWMKDSVDYFKCIGKQWSRDVTNGTDFYEQLNNFYQETDNSQSLSVKHFAALLFCFIIGNILASCVFLWELITQ